MTEARPCELCEAARITPWFHEDDICWVAECESCSVPFVAWRQHGADPPPDLVEHMHAQLSRVAREVIGEEFRIDAVMRQIPDHFHAHARPPFRWR